MTAHFILFVADQARSCAFYAEVLQLPPDLDVPGMTEFQLADGCRLGLMPRAGMERLLGTDAVGPPGRSGELYLYLDHPENYLQRALAAGAQLVSPLTLRNWGDLAAYVHDPDGHLLAFATRPV